MILKAQKSALLLTLVLTAPSLSFGEVACRQSLSPSPIEVALVADLSADALKELQTLIERDPELAQFLRDPYFVQFLQGLSEGRSVDALRPLIYKIWENPDLNANSLGKKTGALLIGPNAGNESRLISIIRNANLKSAPASMSKTEKLKYTAQRMVTQLKGLRAGLANSKKLIDSEMHPSELDSNLFDFYGYLNLKLDSSRLREWETPPGSFAEVKLSDIKGMDPVAFIKVLMLASQIEAPVNQYSDASGDIFSLFPQAARFMGKTKEQAEAHRKARRKLHCTNSWCEEENRHESLLENLARRLIGMVPSNTRPFSADKSLSPFRPEDVAFHVTARANNELAASSTYFLLGAHSEGNTSVYLKNIRKDELKHSTVFAGLYHYLHGSTYWSRLKGVLRKTFIEVADKNDNSEYASIFKTEPVSLIEGLFSQVRYEVQLKRYMESLPLKTLRKFFETEIHLEPLAEVPMDPAKKARKDVLLGLEKSRREALANWPKAQREAAMRLEYFETEFNSELSKVIAQKFNYFKGGEDFGNEVHQRIQQSVASLTAAELAGYGFPSLTASQMELVKSSLKGTLRDYQIMASKRVRQMGLQTQFVDAVHGFDIVRDAKYQAQKKVESVAKVTPISATAVKSGVLAVEKLTPSTFQLSVEKPEGFQFSPGASVTISLQSPHGPQSRTLSISNSPSEGKLEFAVKNSDSYFKEALVLLKAGDSVYLENPKAGLKFNREAPAVMIAGGIGITPFRGIIKSLIEQKATTPVTLLYANSSEKDVAFAGELAGFAKASPYLRINHVISKPGPEWTGDKGRIDKNYLESVVHRAEPGTVYYIVAPLPMVSAVRGALQELGVPATQVVVESFPGYR